MTLSPNKTLPVSPTLETISLSPIQSFTTVNQPISPKKMNSPLMRSPKIRERLFAQLSLPEVFLTASSSTTTSFDETAIVARLRARDYVSQEKFEEAADDCASRLLLSIDESMLEKFIGSGPLKGVSILKKIKENIQQLFRTNKTVKDIFEVNSKQAIIFKCRFRENRVQAVVKKIVRQDERYTNEWIGVLCGPSIGQLSGILEYRKPRKNSAVSKEEVRKHLLRQAVGSVSRTLDIDNILIPFVPVLYNKAEKEGKIKGVVWSCRDSKIASALLDLDAFDPEERYRETLRRISMAREIAWALSKVHANGFVIGGAMAENLMVQQSQSGQYSVRFVEVRSPTIDGHRVSKTIPLSPIGSDMWSFGIFLLELFQGKKSNPFAGKDFACTLGTMDDFQRFRIQKEMLKKLVPGNPLNGLIASLIESSETSSAAQVKTMLEDIWQKFKEQGSKGKSQ